MKTGDVLNGYTILEDFKVVGAGLSKWTFAERGGRQYFIKEFLSPTYPEADAPGSEKIKAKKPRNTKPFVIMITGNQGARHKMYAESLGANEYFTKPVKLDKLMATAEKLLAPPPAA